MKLLANNLLSKAAIEHNCAQLAQGIIQSQQLKLIVYKPQQETIEQWLT